MGWEPHAEQLAGEVTEPMSRWRPLVASTPRHVFVPHWWQWADPEGWTAREGEADEQRWMSAAYSDRTLITRLGPAHADHAQPGEHPSGRPTSSATQPGLVVQMYRHAGITDGADILDVGTGSGYGCVIVPGVQDSAGGGVMSLPVWRRDIPTWPPLKNVIERDSCHLCAISVTN